MEGPHRYPERAIYTDYLRAGGGLALTGGPLVLLDLATVVAVVFTGLTVLFGWFAWRTWTRHRSTIALSGEAIEVVGPRPCRIPWTDLDHIRLAYYAPRRAQDQGWFQLTLRGARGPKLRIDSTLDGFDRILDRVHACARSRELVLDETTVANLGAFGLPAGSRHQG